MLEIRYTFTTVYRGVIYVTIKSLMTQNETMNNIAEVVGLVVSLCSLRYRIQLEC